MKLVSTEQSPDAWSRRRGCRRGSRGWRTSRSAPAARTSALSPAAAKARRREPVQPAGRRRRGLSPSAGPLRPRGRAARRGPPPGRGRGGARRWRRADLDAEAAEGLGGGDGVLVGGVVAEHHRAAAGEGAARGEAAQGRALVRGGGLHLDHHLAGLPRRGPAQRRRGGAAAARQAASALGRGAVVQGRDRALELEPDARAGARAPAAARAPPRAAAAARAAGRLGRRRISSPWPPARQTAAGVRRARSRRSRPLRSATAPPRPAGERGRGRRRLPGGERDRVGVGADLGEGAVEVEKQRVAGAEAQAGEVAEAHAGPRRRRAPRGRRGATRRCPASRTERIMSCQRSRRSSSGIDSAR